MSERQKAFLSIAFEMGHIQAWKELRDALFNMDEEELMARIEEAKNRGEPRVMITKDGHIDLSNCLEGTKTE